MFVTSYPMLRPTRFRQFRFRLKIILFILFAVHMNMNLPSDYLSYKRLRQMLLWIHTFDFWHTQIDNKLVWKEFSYRAFDLFSNIVHLTIFHFFRFLRMNSVTMRWRIYSTKNNLKSWNHKNVYSEFLSSISTNSLTSKVPEWFVYLFHNQSVFIS